jgi:hypothetical protein
MKKNVYFYPGKFVIENSMIRISNSKYLKVAKFSVE